MLPAPRAIIIALCIPTLLAGCDNEDGKTPGPGPDPGQVTLAAEAARGAVHSLQAVELFVDVDELVNGFGDFQDLYSDLFGDELLGGDGVGGVLGDAARAPADILGQLGAGRRNIRPAGEPVTDPLEFDCDDANRICVVTITTRWEDPEDELRRFVQVVTVDTRGTLQDDSDDLILTYEATADYRDGSTGFTQSEELDEDGNLKTGAVRVSQRREWPEGSSGEGGVVLWEAVTEILLNTPDDDSDDVIFGYRNAAELEDGRRGLESVEDMDEEGDEGYRDLAVGPVRYTERSELPDGFEHPEGLQSATTIVLALLGDIDDESDDIWLQTMAEKQFVDGSSAVATGVDEDGDGVLQGGLVRYREERTWPDDARSEDDLRRGVITLVSDLGDENGEHDDLLVSLDLETEHRDGTLTTVEIRPDTPIPDGEEPRSGTLRYETVFPEGAEVVRASRTITGKEDPAPGEAVSIIEDVVEYRNGHAGIDRGRVEIFADGSGRISGQNREGIAYEGEFDEAAGSYSVTYTFPEGSDLRSLSESGSSTRGPRVTRGEVRREVVFADGSQQVSQTRYEQAGAVTRLTVEESPDGGTGTIVVHKGRFFTGITVDWTDAAGHRAKYRGRRWLGGGGVLEIELDDAETPQAPDVTGRIRTLPDGSGTGVLVVHGEGGEQTTVVVGFDRFGRGRVIHSADDIEIF